MLLKMCVSCFRCAGLKYLNFVRSYLLLVKFPLVFLMCWPWERVVSLAQLCALTVTFCVSSHHVGTFPSQPGPQRFGGRKHHRRARGVSFWPTRLLTADWAERSSSVGSLPRSEADVCLCACKQSGGQLRPSQQPCVAQLHPRSAPRSVQCQGRTHVRHIWPSCFGCWSEEAGQGVSCPSTYPPLLLLHLPSSDLDFSHVCRHIVCSFSWSLRGKCRLFRGDVEQHFSGTAPPCWLVLAVHGSKPPGVCALFKQPPCPIGVGISEVLCSEEESVSPELSSLFSCSCSNVKNLMFMFSFC